MLRGWLTRSGDSTHAGMVSTILNSYERKAVALGGRVYQADGWRLSVQQSHTNPMNRPAVTIPIHNKIETKPATFAPPGKTALSSQDATPR
jgi:hypothetical protein